jgi:two-component system nitrogen regulation response regulator GlnG/two-component system response regulator HydG
MPFDPNAPTEEKVVLPWTTDAAAAVPVVPHLVIAWLLDEPNRVGQAARLDRPCWLGRGGAGGASEPEPLAFVKQRPGQSLAVAAIDNTAISRRQLLFTPEEDGRVRVQCVGKRELLHNGVVATECVAAPGDTLMLRNTALFVVEERPVELSAVQHYGRVDFPFGAADVQGLVGETPAAWRLREALAEAAASRAHVLLQGESGAGKELAARVIHERSSRAGGPLVARNAATIPAALVDAELFGTARNYPNTGSPERQGLVGAADGGTLLLDEIGELPEEHQAHLLRVLDTGGEYHRLGESEPSRSDFRLVAATNRGLERLKDDFLARFGYRIEVPGLGARRGDIALLMRALLDRIAAEGASLRERFFGGPSANDVRIDPALVERLARHPYRHHTRELERLLRVAISSSPGEFLALAAEVEAELGEAEEDSTDGAGEVAGRERVAAALEASGGRIGQAAAQLGITRHAMRRLMKKHGLHAE